MSAMDIMVITVTVVFVVGGFALNRVTEKLRRQNEKTEGKK